MRTGLAYHSRSAKCRCENAGSSQVADRLNQFVQQPLQTFILIRPFNPQHLDFYGNRPVGRIEQRKGGVGSSPKSKSARQHRHHFARLEKRSDCGKVGHANGRATTGPILPFWNSYKALSTETRLAILASPEILSVTLSLVVNVLSIHAPARRPVSLVRRTQGGCLPRPHSPSTDPKQTGSALALCVASDSSIAEPDSQSGGRQTLQRVQQILTGLDQPVTVQQLRKLCGLRTATVCSCLARLVKSGVVTRDSKGYQLDLALQSPAVCLSHSLDPQGNGNGQHST